MRKFIFICFGFIMILGAKELDLRGGIPKVTKIDFGENLELKSISVSPKTSQKDIIITLSSNEKVKRLENGGVVLPFD